MLCYALNNPEVDVSRSVSYTTIYVCNRVPKIFLQTTDRQTDGRTDIASDDIR